ncbi:MAG: sigma-70 family RNA polymerase sigma factor [Chloroflexota bacterium]|nr:sigma-70 family RNA polymerase sigma factor [Chloroflexota bacterium]
MTRTAGRQEAALLASATAGDEIAFRRIIAAHHDDMRRVAVYITRDRSLAEEATQAAWLIAWKKLSKVRDEDHLRPWLVSVAAYEAKNVLRNQRRRDRVEATSDTAIERGRADQVTDVSTLDLRAALDRLDPDDRALPAMKYGAGFDSNELALATGISPSGTRSRIERLLKRLREELK